VIALHIAEKTIGPTSPVLVIAEIGVNHDGSVDRALELTEIAAACGADAVKLQIFRAQTLMHASSNFAEYQKDRVAAPSPIEMLRNYELSDGEIDRVVRRIRDLKMLPLATPFSLADVDVIRRLDLPAIKLASPDLVNRPLLERAARLGKPLLISTGAATLDEVQTTAGWMREWKRDFALLHCVSA
jgi:N,N'-diacetyllegionaminate synthase